VVVSALASGDPRNPQLNHPGTCTRNRKTGTFGTHTGTHNGTHNGTSETTTPEPPEPPGTSLEPAAEAIPNLYLG